MSLPVAILAGGLATRLRPLTNAIPKSLVEVAGRPFAEHQITVLKRHGCTHVVFCVGHLGDQIRDVIGDGRRFGIVVDYVDDGPFLLGTGGALKRALPVLGEAFLVMYGDSYLECDFQGIERTFLGSGKQALMTVFENDNRWEQSNVQFEDGVIRAYNKQAGGSAFRYVDYGLSAFRAEAFVTYPENQNFDLIRVYQDLIGREQLIAYVTPDRFFEIGSILGLQELRRKLAQSVHP